MNKTKTIKVGQNEIPVDDAIYAAANRDLEREKKKRQRLRKDGILYGKKSLDEMYAETEFEPSAEDDVEETAIKNILAEQIWQAVNETLDEMDAFIITAYYRDKITESKIAENLEISQPMVNKRRKNAEEQLKSVLEIFKNFI